LYKTVDDFGGRVQVKTDLNFGFSWDLWICNSEKSCIQILWMFLLNTRVGIFFILDILEVAAGLS
jgi:hypothetical protein